MTMLHKNTVVSYEAPPHILVMEDDLSVAKGLVQAREIPILGMPTLDILAFQHAEQRRPIWAVIQAGRGRYCSALYRRRRGR